LSQAICRQCGAVWDECICSSWPLQLIVYSRHQVFCILHNYCNLPVSDDPQTELVQKSRNISAAFESVSCVIAEIEARLAMCGEAGEALVDEAPQVDTIEQLSRPARRALNYCSGWRRRKESYKKWCWETENTRKQKGIKQPLCS